MPLGLVAHTQLPYCIERTENDFWLVLNRNYKPLGTTSKEWVDFEAHPDRLTLNSRTVEAIAKAALNVRRNPETSQIEAIYFYDDGSIPTESAKDWNDYSKRLAKLMNAKVKTLSD